MPRIHDLAELIARPKDGRPCCICEGTGLIKISGSPLKCWQCGGNKTLTGPYTAMERQRIVEPAAIELAELILGATK